MGACPECGRSLSEFDVLCGDCGAEVSLFTGAGRLPSEADFGPPALQPGDRLGGFEIVASVGEGGMGQVFRARDLNLDRDVALKVLRFGGDDDALLLDEARMASALNHPNVVKIYNVARDGGRAFIAMEWAAGDTLASLIPAEGFAPARALALGEQIARGLASAHERGLVHRDVKPGNVMVDPSGEAKVLDFGLAQLTEAAAAVGSGAPVGTVAYMAPEQVRGQPLDARADVFAFGVTLYEMATGQRPFRGETAKATMTAVCARDPRPPRELRPDLPAAAEAFILRCLAKEPDNRFADMGQAAAALADMRHADEAKRRRSLGLWAVAVAAVLLLVGVLGWRVMLHSTEAQALATLRFEHIGGDPAFELLAEGLSQDVHRALTVAARSRPGARTIDRALARRYGADQARALRETLGATLVVSGSLQELGDRVLLDLTLTDAARMKALAVRQASAPRDRLWLLPERAVAALAEALGWRAPPRPRVEWDAESYRAWLYGWAYLAEREDVWRGEAVIAFRQAVDRDPDNAVARLGLARACLAAASKDGAGVWTEAAREALEPIGVKAPAAAEAAYLTACAYALEERRDAALAQLERLLGLDPGNMDGRLLQARLLRESGRVEEAVEACRAALKAAPNHWLALAEWAAASLAVGDSRTARVMAERMLAQVPRNGAGFRLMAEACEAAGRMEEAAEWRARAGDIAAVDAGEFPTF